MLINILVLIFLVIVIGFFSLAESAILSVNYNNVKYRAQNGDKKAKILKLLLDSPENFVTSIKSAINFLILFSGVYSVVMFTNPAVDFFQAFDISLSRTMLCRVCVLLISAGTIFFIMVFGEIIPRKIGVYQCDKIANITIKPLKLILKVFRPFAVISLGLVNILLQGTGLQDKKSVSVTEEEIRMMVDAGSETGGIDEDEMEMINNIFEFNDKTAQDICTHRTDMSAININEPIKDIIPVIMEMKYSRMPVYENSLDNIIGILHIKDFMKFAFENNIDIYDEDNIDFVKLARPAYFVPISKPSDELFEQMRQKKIHLSIVVDEYGGTVGIVTMEDLIEEIMGNIFDEYDDDEYPQIQEVDRNTFKISGVSDLDDVAKALNIELPVNEYDTISGFIISQLGRIPSEGETPEVEFNGVLFKVSLAGEKRIDMVTACRTL